MKDKIEQVIAKLEKEADTHHQHWKHPRSNTANPEWHSGRWMGLMDGVLYLKAMLKDMK